MSFFVGDANVGAHAGIVVLAFRVVHRQGKQTTADIYLVMKSTTGS
jgi:hypothetical protein